MIRERLAADKARARQEGRHAEGKPPYGYRSEKGVLNPIPEQADIVKDIFRDASDGLTPGKIAKRLSAGETSSPRGGVWRANTVRIILTNPAYCGERHAIRKAHVALVSRRLFNEVQRVLGTRTRASKD